MHESRLCEHASVSLFIKGTLAVRAHMRAHAISCSTLYGDVVWCDVMQYSAMQRGASN